MFPRIPGQLVYQPSAWQTFHNILDTVCFSTFASRLDQQKALG